MGSLSPEAAQGNVEEGGSTWGYREHAQGSAAEEEKEMEMSEAMNSPSRGPRGLHELALLHLALVLCAL